MSRAKKQAQPKAIVRRTAGAGRPPKSPNGEWTKRDATRFERWFQLVGEMDASELKLTRWNNQTTPRQGGIKTYGDIFLMMVGASSSWPEQSVCELHTIFHGLAADVEVMVDAEMSKRGARQSGNMGDSAKSDLYSPLLRLAQRLHALGEIIPRIVKANYVLRSEAEAAQ